MYLVINMYTNSNDEQFINDVIKCTTLNEAQQYMRQYACIARNDCEVDGSLEDYIETKNSITLKGKYYTNYFEVYNADYFESHNIK